MILLWTAEVYVIDKRSNKEIKWKFLFDSGSESFFSTTCLYSVAALDSLNGKP